MRFYIKLEYDGTNYVGWQRQQCGASIQETLEIAAKNLLGEEVLVHGAGRTDAGVHALGQVAHFDCDRKIECHKIRDGLNFYLKSEKISILSVQNVPKDFHSRFSAVERSYVYKILNRRSPPTFDIKKKWHVPVPLNIDNMILASQLLIGTHDFSTFRGANCQSNSPIKKIDKIIVTNNEDNIEIKVIAKSFLYKQVRSIVGSLKYVGEGKWSVIDMRKALEACDRKKVGFVAPAHGLYLFNVLFDSNYEL